MRPSAPTTPCPPRNQHHQPVMPTGGPQGRLVPDARRHTRSHTARRPPARTLRAALYGHAFNPQVRAATPDAATVKALAWLERASLAVQQLSDPQASRGTVGADLGRDRAPAQRPGKEAPGGRQVTPPGQQDVDDLAMLVDRHVQAGPLAGDLYVRLMNEPLTTRSVAAWPGRLDELRGEALDPPVDGDVIHGDSTLGQQVPHITAGQAIPQVPADRDRDDPRAGTGNQRRLKPGPMISLHQSPARPDPPTQQCRSGSSSRCCQRRSSSRRQAGRIRPGAGCPGWPYSSPGLASRAARCPRPGQVTAERIEQVAAMKMDPPLPTRPRDRSPGQSPHLLRYARRGGPARLRTRQDRSPDGGSRRCSGL